MRSDGTKDDPSGDPRSQRADLRTLHLWHLQPVRDLLLIAAISGTVYAGYAIRTITVPLLVAFLLAYLFEPVIARMTQWRRMTRPVAVSVIFAGLLVGIAATVGIVVPLAVGQTLAFGESLRSGRYDSAIARVIEAVPEEYRNEVRDWTDRIVHPKSRAEPAAPEPALPEGEPPSEALPTATGTERANGDGEDAAGSAAASQPSPGEAIWSLDRSILSLLGAGSQRVYSFALAVLQLGLVAFLIPFYFYYFSVHWQRILEFLQSLVPVERRESVFAIAGEMDRAIAGFVRGRIVIAFLMGAMFAIGWQICGVPYGIALGLLIGAFSIVPYLGGVGIPIAVGLLMADQFTLEEAERMSIWGMILWPTLVFIVVQSIEGYVLTPIIAGKATNLDPVTIVVAILAGGSIAGVYGMLLAIPIAACGKIAAIRLLLPRVRAWARGTAPDPLPLDRS
ncbi:MAG: hypothetical protein RL136_1554 [Planctomycetota bacterium]|jgi:predicted PurR-regulated permease PerM